MSDDALSVLAQIDDEQVENVIQLVEITNNIDATPSLAIDSP